MAKHGSTLPLLLPLVLIFGAGICRAKAAQPATQPGDLVTWPEHPMARVEIPPEELSQPPKPIFDPRTYGAKADGIQYDTAAVQTAIDACAGSGGSVYLSNGKFLTAHLTLKGNMTLYIEKGAVLLGGTNPEDYPVVLPAKPSEAELCRSLLYADGVDHLVLDGGGVIDGQGQHLAMTGKEPDRPSILRIFSSQDVIVRNLTLSNPRMWTQAYVDCKNVTIDHETVNAPPRYCPNLDGLDICDSSDVAIRNCRINSDDDSICLKGVDGSGLKHITIENNLIRNTGADGIKLGTGSAGPITDIHILNNVVLSASLGGLCIESVDGADISDFTVRGLDLIEVSQPIFIRLASRSHAPGSISGVTIEDVRAISTSTRHAPSCTITGIPSARISGVVIKNAYFEMPGGLTAVPRTPPEKEDAYPQSNLFGNVPGYAFFVRHADGVVFDHVTVGRYKADVRPWLATDDAKVQTIDCHDLQQIQVTRPASP